MFYEYQNQLESLDALSTVETLRWTIFLYESLHSNHGEAKLLVMIKELLRRVGTDAASGLRAGSD